MIIMASVREGVRLVQRHERVRFSPLAMVLSARRFAPRLASPFQKRRPGSDGGCR